MKLTKEQVQGIKTLYGDDEQGAINAIKKIDSKKGKFRFFNADGTVNISIAELEEKLNKESKPKPKKEIEEEGTYSFAQELRNIAYDMYNSLDNLEEYFYIVAGLRDIARILKKKKEELRDVEISNIDDQIAELEEKKKELLALKEETK